MLSLPSSRWVYRCDSRVLVLYHFLKNAFAWLRDISSCSAGSAACLLVIYGVYLIIAAVV
jgi:hypothetical protein